MVDYQGALQRRLGIIDSMGTSALNAARMQSAQQPVSTNAGGMGGGYTGGIGSNSPFINFGRQLQGMGFRVSENPYFGGVTQGAHVANSDHYRGRAYDVNFGAGTSAREQHAIDGILGLIRQRGFRYIWRQPGHFNHIHIYF